MLQKTILLLALCAFHLHSFSQECKSFTPIVSAHYIMDGKPGVKTGFEAGYIGHRSKFGYSAGFELEFHDQENHSGEEYANETGNMFKMYFKGSYRIYRKGNSRMLFLTVTPEINMKSKFDLRSGIRLILPVTAKFGLGLEPSASVLNGNFTTALQIVAKL
jgi:hypothetical protein